MYTLDQLAHFDRCLLPKDFENQLIEAGMNAFNAYTIAQSNQARKGIVSVYQVYVLGCKDSDVREQTKEIIERVLANFFAKV